MKKILIVISVLIALVAAAWLGASIYVGRSAATIIHALGAKAGLNAAVRMVNLEHKQGLLASNGQFEIRLNDVSVDANTGKQLFALQVNYSIDHLLLPSSSMRFNWVVQPTGQSVSEFNRLFGSEVKLQGQGKLAYGGQALSTLKLPELAMKQGKDLFHLSPSSGNIVWGDQSVALDWKTDRLSSRGDDYALDIQGVSFTTDIKNRARGIGTMQFSVDKFSTKTATAEAISVQAAISEQNDKLDLQVTPKLTMLTFPGHKISDLVFAFAVKGLDVASVESLSAISTDSNDFRNLTADEQARAGGALRKLVEKGFTIGLPQITAKMGAGSIKGDVLLEVSQPAGLTSSRFSIAQSVRVTGQLEGQGKVLDNTQKRLALLLGLATESRDSLKANVQFADGILKANGKTYDLRGNLTYFDGLITGYLYPR